MKVRLYKPQNAVLRKLIECFYTLKRPDKEKSKTYAAFPNVYSMICQNANASVKFFEHNLTIKGDLQDRIETTLINFDKPGLNRYEGAADEIVIYFKPLGLNAFLGQDLRDYAPESFCHFAPFDDYYAAMKEIFALKSDFVRIKALEKYLLSKHKNFTHPFLQSVVGEMMLEEVVEVKEVGVARRTSITALVRRHNVSRPTLNKQFERHLCTTPSQFRKVVRFRKALAQYRNKFRAQNLATVSHEAGYFD